MSAKKTATKAAAAAVSSQFTERLNKRLVNVAFQGDLDSVQSLISSGVGINAQVRKASSDTNVGSDSSSAGEPDGDECIRCSEHFTNGKLQARGVVLGTLDSGNFDLPVMAAIHGGSQDEHEYLLGNCVEPDIFRHEPMYCFLLCTAAAFGDVRVVHALVTKGTTTDGDDRSI